MVRVKGIWIVWVIFGFYATKLSTTGAARISNDAATGNGVVIAHSSDELIEINIQIIPFDDLRLSIGRGFRFYHRYQNHRTLIRTDHLGFSGGFILCDNFVTSASNRFEN